MYMHSEEALWTFNIPTRTWRHREAFGDLPGPHLAIAMTDFKGQIFLLCNAPEDTDPAELYVLDLDTFTWRVLRPRAAPECFLLKASAVRVQVQLILYFATLVHGQTLEFAMCIFCSCAFRAQ